MGAELRTKERRAEAETAAGASSRASTRVGDVLAASVRRREGKANGCWRARRRAEQQR